MLNITENDQKMLLNLPCHSKYNSGVETETHMFSSIKFGGEIKSEWTDICFP